MMRDAMTRDALERDAVQRSRRATASPLPITHHPSPMFDGFHLILRESARPFPLSPRERGKG
jgi:hypothetical protein